MKVNETPGTDSRDWFILKRLRDADKTVSGQILADELGISRVALWKRIEKLNTMAYRIGGSRQGYQLLQDDALAGHEFGDGGDTRYHAETHSTMDEAWRWAESGAVNGAMVIAESQTAGRGQQGRVWVSPPGGLYLTLVLHARLPMTYAGSLMLEAGSWLAEWVDQHCGARLELQWPNDLLHEGRKIAGVLVEVAGSPDSPRFFTLGLGFNFRNLSVGNREVTGLSEISGVRVRRRELAADFRRHMVEWAKSPEVRPQWWASWSPWLGSMVRVTQHPEQGMGFQARSLAYSRQGGLVLDQTNGQHILPGEVLRVEVTKQMAARRPR